MDDLSLHCKAIGITSYHGVSVFSREYFSPFLCFASSIVNLCKFGNSGIPLGVQNMEPVFRMYKGEKGR